MTERTDRREETLIKKYGSKEALAEKRRQWQLKSRKNPNTKKGGFAALPSEEVVKVSLKGHKARWGYEGDKNV